MLKKMEEQQAGKRGEISQQLQTEQDGGGAQLKKSVVGNAEVNAGVRWQLVEKGRVF